MPTWKGRNNVKLPRMIAAAVAAAGLFAGAQMASDAEAGMVTSSPGKSYYYSPNQVRYVAGGGEFWTIVQGNPFAMPKIDFDEAVTSHMDGRPHWAAPGQYTTAPSEDAKTAYWVVLVFNPPAGFDGYRACEGYAGAGRPNPSGAVEVVAAFCSKVHVLGETRAYLDHASGPGDPAFAQLIHQVQTDIFPRRLPDPGGKKRPAS
jgi:hypothetical protein